MNIAKNDDDDDEYMDKLNRGLEAFFFQLFMGENAMCISNEEEDLPLGQVVAMWCIIVGNNST